MKSLNNYKPSNILVTGGAGFIGLNFLEKFSKKKNIKFTVIDSLTYASSKKKLLELKKKYNFSFHKLDINQRNQIKKILNEHKIDTIINFAAESHVDRSIYGAKKFIDSNILGTFNLIDVAKNYWQSKFNLNSNKCRFHQISTDEVFGSLKSNKKKFKETNKYSPNSPYSASKASADLLINSYINTYQFPATISYCSNNYGKYQNNEKLIPTIIKSLSEKKNIPVYGNGSNVRDWIHVEDHCDAVFDIIKKGKVGNFYCIGANSEYSNINLINKIINIFKQFEKNNKFNYSKLITYVEDRLGHDHRYAIDTNKIYRELNWHPKISLNKGLTKTIKWYYSKYNK